MTCQCSNAFHIVDVVVHGVDVYRGCPYFRAAQILFAGMHNIT